MLVHVKTCNKYNKLYFFRVVDWLDEYHPGSFRQAQVSFSTRIPSAFPLGDAITMSNNICLYHTSCCHLQLVFRDVVKSVSASRSPVNGEGVFFFFTIYINLHICLHDQLDAE